MGIVVRFPRRHVRASSVAAGALLATIPERASKVTAFTPFSDASRAKGAKWVAGMPRVRQQLTDDLLSDSADATALVPPRAFMTESGVSMDANLVCIMQTCQETANRQPTFPEKCGALGRMIDTREVIFWRLDGLKKAYMPDATDEAFANAIGIDKSTYSAIKKCDRNLSFETGCYIKEKWGVSLDWLYYGDLQQSAVQVMAGIGQRPVVAAAERRKSRSREK